MSPDPYRTLGLTRGASLEDVKRAYRRLAKANHPDRAGEGSLARFLEIQDAYDRIAGGVEDGRRATGASDPGPRRPWDADPGRADATRRAYGSRTRRTRTGSGAGTSAGATGAGSGAGPTGPRAGESMGAAGSADRDAGGAAAGPEPGPEATTGRPHRRGRGDRPPTKATLGSTSYDGVDDGPFEPDWGGASWYGTTTGTYWTLNPKEYADPRKHGPEYQARARRARGDRKDPPAVEPEPASPPPVEPHGGTAAGRPAGPTHTTSSWWDATSATTSESPPVAGRTAAREQGAGERLGGTRPRWRGGAAPAGAGPADPSVPVVPVLPVFDAARWLEAGRGGTPARVGRAVLGWAPIALGIGWLAGEVTGCGRYSAGCDAAVAPLAWLAQVVVLALLLLIPRLGSAASVATLVTLAAAVPGALILSATGTDAADTMAPLALGGLLVLGWAAGIVAGVVREFRLLLGTPTEVPDARTGDRATAAAPPDGPTDGATPVS